MTNADVQVDEPLTAEAGVSPAREGGLPAGLPRGFLARARAGAGNLRGRILLWYVVLLAVSIALAILALRQVLVVRLAEDIDVALAQEVEEVRLLADGVDPATGQPFAGNAAAIFDTFFVRSVPGEYEAFYGIVDGRPYKRTVAPASLFDDPAIVSAWRVLAEPTWGDAETSAGPVRWLAVPLRDGERTAGVFVVAHYALEQREQIELAIQVMIAVSVGVLLLASLAAWVAAGRAIAPLRTLTSTARGIDERDLAARIPVSGTDEVAELTATLNSMLDRLEAAFTTQRQFLDDVGHELRTPITIIRGHLELLDDDPIERGRTVELVLDELDRMSRYVTDLMLLARAEQPNFLHPEPIELAEFVESLLLRVRRLGDQDWRAAETRPAVLVADPDRLTQAMTNLAVNAARHTPAGGVVEIGAAVDGESARLWVRDEGTGIAPGDRARIFQRFARGRDRLTGASDGSGLGLAIVRAIAGAHGGDVTLDSEPGRGSTFTIRIPLMPPEAIVAR